MSSNESSEPNFENLINTNREQNGEQIEGFNEFEGYEPGGSTLSNSVLNNQQNNAPKSQENHEQKIPQLQPEKVDIIIEKKENYILKEKYFKKHPNNKNIRQIRPRPKLTDEELARSPFIDYFEIEKIKFRGNYMENSKNYVKRNQLGIKMQNSERRQINIFQNTQNSNQSTINPSANVPHNNILRNEAIPFFPNGYYFRLNIIPIPVFCPNNSNAFPLMSRFFIPLGPYPPRFKNSS